MELITLKNVILIMRRVFIVFLLVASARSFGQSYSSVVTTFFSGVTFNEACVTLEFKAVGSTYTFIRSDKGHNVSGSIRYGQSMVVNSSETLRLLCKHESLQLLKIKNLEGSDASLFLEWSLMDGWGLIYTKDHRSFGGELGVSVFFIPITLSEEERSTLKAKYSNAAGYAISEHVSMLVIEKYL